MKKIKSGIYSSKELENMLGNRMAISRMVDRGELKSAGDGYYYTDDDHLFAPRSRRYYFLDKFFPGAILSKHSALYEHGLWGYEGDILHVDVERENTKFTSKLGIEFHRTKNRSGTTTKRLDGVTLRIYTQERAVFEVLKMQGGTEDSPSVSQVVRKYLENNKGDSGAIDRLKKHQDEFGQEGREIVLMAQAMLNATTDAKSLLVTGDK